MTALRRYRIASGYKQDAFAEKAHVCQGHLCALELGTKKPSPALAAVMADRLGVSVETLFPDGVAVRPKKYKQRVDDGSGYLPEERDDSTECPPMFSHPCPRCGRELLFDTAGRIPVFALYDCPACSAVFSLVDKSMPTPTHEPPKKGYHHKYCPMSEGVRV